MRLPLVALLSLLSTAAYAADPAPKQPAPRPPAPAARAAEPEAGWSVGIGQAFGASSASLLVVDWWLSTQWGLGFETGYSYHARDVEIPTGNTTRLARRVDYAVEPSLAARWSPVSSGRNRFFLVLGAGPRLDKPGARALETGLTAYAGPGIDYDLGGSVSFGAEARFALAAARERKTGTAAGASAVASLHWWFL